ncbi:thioredoxin family protein [Anaerotalea alkaliphila]|uniref:Thioredoxin family protein n=1 Tax=Anaerotalea alkaliphila TaxID=2662126 RepID=A0A7X5KP29_9FIRM|nr:thioredoxin family protein [Anaerotalea alkaliphila]NDL67427.1 thioredoxin family protein [Anaerotalea alkaliphila]
MGKGAVVMESKEALERMMGRESPLVLYFTSEGCGVCQAVLPRLLEIAGEVPVAKIGVDSLREVAGQHLVFAVPTLLVWHEGKEILRESRFIDFNRVERVLYLLRP